MEEKLTTPVQIGMAAPRTAPAVPKVAPAISIPTPAAAPILAPAAASVD